MAVSTSGCRQGVVGHRTFSSLSRSLSEDGHLAFISTQRKDYGVGLTLTCCWGPTAFDLTLYGNGVETYF